MPGKHLPENREDSLVRQHHLPRRLDHHRCRDSEVVAEWLVHDPLPGIELEQRVDPNVLAIAHFARLGIPSNVRHRQELYLESGLCRGLGEIGRRHSVLEIIDRREVHDGTEWTAARQVVLCSFPVVHQLLMDRVELIGSGMQRLEPVPLNDGDLEQRRRCVGVVFEHLGR